MECCVGWYVVCWVSVMFWLWWWNFVIVYLCVVRFYWERNWCVELFCMCECGGVVCDWDWLLLVWVVFCEFLKVWWVSLCNWLCDWIVFCMCFCLWGCLYGYLVIMFVFCCYGFCWWGYVIVLFVWYVWVIGKCCFVVCCSWVFWWYVRCVCVWLCW